MSKTTLGVNISPATKGTKAHIQNMYPTINFTERKYNDVTEKKHELRFQTTNASSISFLSLANADIQL